MEIHKKNSDNIINTDNESDENNLEIVSDTDDDDELTESDPEIKENNVSVYPNIKSISTQTKKSDKDDDTKRLRKEWSTEEDTIFLKGLREHKLDFAAIQKLIPHRSRSQIRTHYRYLARSLHANAKSKALGGKKVRRLRNRGRPSRSKKEEEPSELFKNLTDIIAELEQKFPSKQRGRPSKSQIGEVMQFNTTQAPQLVQPVPVLIVNADLRIATNIISNAEIPKISQVEKNTLQNKFNYITSTTRNNK